MTAFEIHVEGELAAPTVHRLGCVAQVAGPQTLLRIETTSAGLRDLVEDCSQRGGTVESILRVDPS